MPITHPVDRADTRRWFVTYLLVDTVVNAVDAVWLGFLLWYVVGPLPALIAATAVALALGVLASRLQRRAWSPIPKGHRDEYRSLPDAWRVTRSLGRAAVTVVVLCLVAYRLRQPDVADRVGGHLVGAYLGYAVVLALLAGAWVRSAMMQRRDVPLVIAGNAALVAAVAVGAWWAAGAGGQPAADLVRGAAVVAVPGVAYAAYVWILMSRYPPAPG